MTLTAHNAVTPEAAEKTRLLLADLWLRNRPVIEDRLAILDRFAAADRLTAADRLVPADPAREELRSTALDVAHKLSGSLGMFGFAQGTLVARELEQLLGAPDPDVVRIAELSKQLRAMLLPAS